jgi:3-hydroxybutyryl-CoA dehydrogenase
MDVNSIKQVAVIGAGLMGHGLAQIFAVKGCQVTLLDVKEEMLEPAINNIRANLTLMSERGIGRKEDIEPAISRIKTTASMEEAAAGAEFIVEAAAENLAIKQQIFKELDELTPEDTILATNTSVISITEIAEKASGKGRIVGTHFWNPPFLIPLVEVIKGEQTETQVVDDTIALMKKMGKHPVRVNKDVPGFVGNRLQHALWREAISILEHGIATPETVDEVIKHGFGIRLPVLGPLENSDLAGLDLTLAIHDYILKHLDRSQEASPFLREKVEAGDLGFKTGRGFSEWTPEDIGKSRKNLLEYLLKWVKDNEQS